MKLRHAFYIFFALVTLFVDMSLGFSRAPFFTLILCVIVIVYEIVHPYIYQAR
jgi:hypothetical protein